MTTTTQTASPTADYVPTSTLLGGLLRDAPSERVTLDWLLANLGERSYGIVLLFLGLIGLVPGVSILSGLLMLLPAMQMILSRPAPDLPDFVGARAISVSKIDWLLRRLTPTLAWLERFSYPRWQTRFHGGTRSVGLMVMLLALSALSPIPFAAILPNLAIMLIAFALLEKDGLVLLLATFFAAVSLIVTAATIWASIVVPQYF